MKKGTIPILFLFLTLILSGCFSPWQEDKGSFNINLGHSGNGRYLDAPEYMPGLSYTIKVTDGAGPDQIRENVGEEQKSLKFVVDPGQWNITVEAYEGEVLYAVGSRIVTIKPGNNGSVAVEMKFPDDVIIDDGKFWTIEVDNWKDLYNAVLNANADNGTVILLTGDMTVIHDANNQYYGPSPKICISNKQITLVANDPVNLTRGAGFTDSFFQVSEEGTLTLGNSEMSGSITIDGSLPNQNQTLTASLISVLYGGKLDMNSGVILKNNNAYTNGGGVHVSGGTFTMKGGTICGNTVSSSSAPLFGGGVYIENGTFNKVGGVIYGYDVNDPSNSNKVLIKGEPMRGNGHAVYACCKEGNQITVAKCRDTTASDDNMSFSPDGDIAGFDEDEESNNPPDNLAEYLIWINTQQSGDYTYELKQDETINPTVLSKTGINLTLKSQGSGNCTINLDSNSSPGSPLFMISNGFTLILENVTLKGHSASNSSLVYVDGTFVMKNWAKIADNNGSGVFIDGGTFTMNGGEIKGNSYYGVYVNPNGTFYMYGGEISENNAGVCVEAESTFTVGGNAGIYENTDASETSNNVYLKNGAYITLGTVNYMPGNNMNIHVRTESEDGVIVQSGASQNYENYFHADEEGMAVKFRTFSENNQLVIEDEEDVIVSNAIELKFWLDEANGVLLIDGDVAEPITLTKGGEESFTASITDSAFYSIEWAVGLDIVGIDDSIAINGDDYNPGTYYLSVTVWKNGVPYSAEVSFTVIE